MKTVLKQCLIEVNGVDLSDHASSVELSMEKADIDTTNFSGGGKEHAHGLSDDKITINFQQDFDAAEVNATLMPLYTGESEFTVVVRPNPGAVSATNPNFTATCILLKYQPLSGKVGDLSETKVEFQTQRTGITMATS
ncbi:hypothetical protein [Nocardia nova]|jgi:hypothetical protein|uniref:hypothetical protein n=1 Tax=Nocardia nova TaxID=37330 RepID=UPI002738710A|nr:hypothetical protein [Nocardia nova]